MNRQTLEYDLYLDESGDFKEVSQIKAERLTSKSRKKGAPSQLAGLLIPRGSGDHAANEITSTANKRANSPPTRVIHATDIIEDSYFKYLRVTEAIIKGVEGQSEWQPVRLVNLEKVSYYDRATTYPNLVAELVLRAFQQKSKEFAEGKIGIRLIDPKYKLQEPTKHTLDAREYIRRIAEHLGFAAVRYGLAREQRRWRFDGVISREYRHSPALQICDVLSNASYDSFANLRKQRSLSERLRKLFDEYDFTLTTRELFDRVDELVKEHSFGMALMIVAETLVHALHATKQDQDFAGKLQERLDHIIQRLGRMDFRGRDPQLALLIGWLDQLVGQQRLLDKGYEIAQWLLTHVEASLRERLSAQNDEATLDWFAYSLRRWALTACNHKGVLLQGQAEVEAMRSLQPSIAKQWERIPLVMDGLIAQAVHYTDCFEFDMASQRMRFVADSLKMQSNQFHELMPQDFPERLRFDLRARALGTLVQSEIFAGATVPARLQSARQASEEAVTEFTSFSDRSRQYQYRCHLETVAKDFETARKYLVKSLEGTDVEPADYSHNRIAELIREFSIDPEWKAEFTLLHWLRIGSYACLTALEQDGRRPGAEQVAIESERDQFLVAIDHSEQLDSDACQGRLSDYPAHSILRFVAVINAARSRWDESLLALQRLHALDPISKEQFVLAMILLAAQTEVATLMWEDNEVKSRALLTSSDSSLLGLRRLIQQIEEKTGSRLTSITSMSKRLSETIESCVQTSASSADFRPALLELSCANAY